MIARILTSRWAICLYNIMICTLTIAAVYRAVPMLVDAVNDFNFIEEMLDGVGIILVAYGVALEERDTIMKFFNFYPKYYNDIESATDRLCHFYGLWFLIIGLFMEVTAEAVKLPNTILNTGGIEKAVFGLGFVLCAIAAYMLLRHCWLLILPQAKKGQ